MRRKAFSWKIRKQFIEKKSIFREDKETVCREEKHFQAVGKIRIHAIGKKSISREI